MDLKTETLFKDMPSIDDLPGELLEYILSLVSPYNDLENCKNVSKRWNCAAKRVDQRRRSYFVNSLTQFKLEWGNEICDVMSPRLHISSCYVDGIVYLFGGSSVMYTEFNDLYSLNLANLQMKRIIASGDIPSPKSSATLCVYQNKLILYGGCANTSTTTIFQDQIHFNELHVYDIGKNVWKKHSDGTEIRISDHLATVHRNQMIVLGGDTEEYGITVQIRNISVIRCLNLDTFVWSDYTVSAGIPDAFDLYAQFQVYIDDDHLLIYTHCSQTYLLTMDSNPWRWSIVHQENILCMPLPTIDRPNICLPFVAASGYLITMKVEASHIRDGAAKYKRLKELGLNTPKLFVGDARNVINSNRIVWKEPRCCSKLFDYTPFAMEVGNAELVFLGRSMQDAGPSSYTYIIYAKAPKFSL